MGKVLALSRKGAYEVPKERFFNKIDLIHGMEGLVGGMENAQKEDYPSGIVKVVSYFPLVEIARLQMEDGKVFDAVVDFTGNVKPLGIGTVDESGEPEYEKVLKNEEFPVTLGEIDEEDYEEIKSEIAEAVEDELLPAEAKSKPPAEVLKDYLDRPKELKSISLTAYKILKKKGKGGLLQALQPPRKITAKEVLEKGERLTLTGIAVGADEKGNVVVFYVPERVFTVPATKVAKEIHARRPDFRLFSYLSGLSEKALKDEERRKKIIKKVKSMIEEIKKKGEGYDEELIKAVGEKFKAAAKNPTPESVREVVELARKSVFKVIKNYLREEGVINPARDLLASTESKTFLRNNPDAIGLPLIDFRRVSRMGVVSVPRVIDTPKEGFMVRMTPKPVSLFEEKDGKKVVIHSKADSTAIRREYRIYKALKPFYTGKIKEDTPVTMEQLKSLFNEGFENFKGLEALKKELSESRNATQLVRFIDHVKEVIGSVLFEEGATVEDVQKKVQSDEVIRALYEGMEQFLAERQGLKAVRLDRYAEVDGKTAVTRLFKEGVLYKKNGEYRVSYRAVSEKSKELEKELGLKVPLRSFAGLAASTLNATERVFSAEFPALREAEKVAKHVETAYTFGEKGIKAGEFLVPNLDSEGKEFVVEGQKVDEKKVSAWKKVLKSKEGEIKAEEEAPAVEKEIEKEEKRTVVVDEPEEVELEGIEEVELSEDDISI